MGDCPVTSGRVLSEDGGPWGAWLAQSAGTSDSQSIAHGPWSLIIPTSVPFGFHSTPVTQQPFHVADLSVHSWESEQGGRACPRCCGPALRTRVACASLRWGGRAVQLNSTDLAVHGPRRPPPLSKRPQEETFPRQSGNLDVCPVRTA